MVAKRRAAYRWLAGVWAGRTRPVYTIRHAMLEAGEGTTNEIISRADALLRQHYPKQNPREFGPDDYATGEGVVTPLSESQELSFVVGILNDALGRDLPGGARYDVSKAVEVLLRLKDQALKGLHRNPGQSGGIHIDIGSHNPRRRARNPPLVLMGANPPERGTMLRAKWARIEYCRPDDPEGKGVARFHDFPDGFVARGLADGSVLLRHPKGRRLWTRR